MIPQSDARGTHPPPRLPVWTPNHDRPLVVGLRGHSLAVGSVDRRSSIGQQQR